MKEIKRELSEAYHAYRDDLKFCISQLRSGNFWKVEGIYVWKPLWAGVRLATIGVIFHPVATFRAVMQVGDSEDVVRNLERAVSLPKLPIGR